MFLDEDTGGATYTYVRLGKVQGELGEVPEGAHQSSNNKISNDARYENCLLAGREGDISVEDTVLGYYFDGFPDKLYMIKVRAWEFGVLYIGNCSDDWAANKFDPKEAYEAPFRSAKDFSGLHKLVRTYLKGRDDVGDTFAEGVPYQLPYTLNTFSPANYSLG